jgi:Rieske Fe-S protein
MSGIPYNLQNNNIGYSENFTSKPEIVEGFACENGLDLACPHAGCQVNKEGDKYVCPCHNSQFKLDGTLIQGPATTGLKKCQQ